MLSAPVLLLRLHAVVVLVMFLFFGYKLLLLLTGKREQLRQLRARTRWADSVLLTTALLTGLGTWVVFPEPFNGWISLISAQAFLLLLFFIGRLRREQAGLATWQYLGAMVCYGMPAFGALTIHWPHKPNTIQQALLGAVPNAAARAPLTAPGRAEAEATPDAAPPVDTLAISATDQALLDSVQTGADQPAAPPVLAAGQALYTQNCAVCHGPDGKLGLNGARDLTKSNLNAAGRIYQVANGSISKKMPAFQDKLTEEEIRQVVEYSLMLR